MTLTLYLHPLSSFCHKALVALYENETPFEAVTVNFGDSESREALFSRWPIGKIPVLHDSATGMDIPETSIMIEYVQQHYPGAAQLLPVDAEQALQTRLWDRFFDLYVHMPMQRIVGERLRRKIALIRTAFRKPLQCWTRPMPFLKSTWQDSCGRALIISPWRIARHRLHCSTRRSFIRSKMTCRTARLISSA